MRSGRSPRLRVNHSCISASRAASSCMESIGFWPAVQRRAIIMPALMLRSVRSGSLLVTALSLGTAASVAQAGGPSPCAPSMPLILAQNTDPNAPAAPSSAPNAAVPGAPDAAPTGAPNAPGTQPAPARAARSRDLKNAPVDLEMDNATIGVD